MTNNTATTRNLETMNAAGRWNDSSDFGANPEARLTECMAYHKMTRAQVVASLEAGKSLRYGTDWYEQIRLTPAPVAAPAPVALVRCSCGHSVPRSQVMSASMGTSCPRCYDRMSE